MTKGKAEKTKDDLKTVKNKNVPPFPLTKTPPRCLIIISL